MTRDSSRFDLDGIGYPVRHATVRRMALLKLMIERIGVDENRGPLISAILRQLERTCLDCARAGKCDAWLGNDDEEDAYRESCPNASLLDCLPRASPGAGPAAGEPQCQWPPKRKPTPTVGP